MCVRVWFPATGRLLAGLLAATNYSSDKISNYFFDKDFHVHGRDQTRVSRVEQKKSKKSTVNYQK